MTNSKDLILIVDDNPQNIQFLGGLLTENGYDLGVAQNGVETLEFVKDKTPDLILLDIMMPEMDGYETCERLKSDKRYRHIPVIFLTAKTETEDIVKGFHLGGVDYVTKPFITEELLARVQTHVQMKTLKSLLPMCAKCKKIRDEEGLWNQLEAYIEKHTDSDFSHGMCGECAEELYGDSEWYKKRKREGKR
jgi:CheY-like chemotaxis protein